MSKPFPYYDFRKVVLSTGTMYFPKEDVKKVMLKDEYLRIIMALHDDREISRKYANKIASLNRQIPPRGISEEQYIKAWELHHGKSWA